MMNFSDILFEGLKDARERVDCLPNIHTRLMNELRTDLLGDWFWDKDKCDVVRELVLMCILSLDDVVECLGYSEDWVRDSVIVKKLAERGMPLDMIIFTIKTINHENL